MSPLAFAFRLFPDQASTTAEKVDLLYFVLVGMSGFFMLAIGLTALYFLVRYRRGKQVDRSSRRLPTLSIELAWIAGPLVLVLILFWWGSHAYLEMQQPPAGAVELYVVGKQWMWQIQHPQGHREIDELHVPVGRPVQLIMTSEDVIHSFFIPAFRVKADVVPGRYTRVWFEPTKAGTYHLFCAEYCGSKHSQMIGRVVVMEAPEYEEWLATKGERVDPMVVSGENLFRGLGCTGCHSPGSQIRAPSLEGLFGSPVPVETGGTLIADEQYIHDSILLPEADVVAGYEPVMPSYRGQISEEQLMQLVAYIKSLGAEPEPTEREVLR
ncbi:MAG: cytochrome c oxidase subunit II [Opitutales bacterium]